MGSTLQRINQGTLTMSSQIPFYDTVNGADRRASISDLSALLQEQQDVADGFITQYQSPSSSGFSITVAPFVAGGNVFLLVTPAAGYGAGTIIMPVAPVHGQKVTAHCTQSVTVLTVSGNGAALVSGAPSTLTAGACFSMRYDGVTRGWYRSA